jgi:uncharacterized repeat protein (TIGR01451 family)
MSASCGSMIARGCLRRAMPSAWLALVVLPLCSCRSMSQLPLPPAATEAQKQQRAAASLAKAVEKTKSVPKDCTPQTEPLPIPLVNGSPWAPPGIEGPWPHDEYLFDGGDREVQVNVTTDGQLQGMELEDTVAIYDTLDGGKCIEPSNRVCLYSPRFAAVRRVTSVVMNEQRDQPIGVERPVRVYLHQDNQLATTAIQPVQPEGEIGRKQPNIELVNEGAIPAASRQPIAAMRGGLSPHERFKVMRIGVFDESEKARLLLAVDAAITWSHDQAVQVVLDGREAVSVTSDEKAQVTYRVDVPDHPCLRVIKTASTKVAKPGDVVDFTIRFDNTGDQTIKHVALIDNLTTRLEYVPDTAQSSRAAQFATQVNEGESLQLRWEFSDPLPPGEGGLVRFNCRVR